MNLAVATTGYQQLMLRWMERLRENGRARDNSMLDPHTPDSLREIWADLQHDHGPLEGTATISTLASMNRLASADVSRTARPTTSCPRRARRPRSG